MIKYNPLLEQINIQNYSPKSYINEISEEYKYKPFYLPIINKDDKLIPIHPDMFKDLRLSKSLIVLEKKVYPTSSFRTVYEENENIFYKLPVLRQITRSIRNLTDKELERSLAGKKLLIENKKEGFYFLDEIGFKDIDENFNYIKRIIPDVKIYPWFYVIASNDFYDDFLIKCMKNIIDIWMYYASIDVYFDSFHTQNLFVDDDCNIYYRDLSDIRYLNIDILKPSFSNILKDKKEMLSICFDRSVCNQNIDHLFRYHPSLTFYKNDLKKYIEDKIKFYNLSFPDYSLDYDKNKEGHIPVKIDLVYWRQ